MKRFDVTLCLHGEATEVLSTERIVAEIRDLVASVRSDFVLAGFMCTVDIQEADEPIHIHVVNG